MKAWFAKDGTDSDNGGFENLMIAIDCCMMVHLI